MKTYINIILIASLLLLIFPFLGFPELWENIYVIVLGFIVGSTMLFLRHKSGLIAEVDEEASLQDYVKELQERFKNQPEELKPKNTSRITEVRVDDE